MHQPVAVVTGASSRGFGEQIVRDLAAEGWLTISLARREDRLAALAEEVEGEYQICDVSSWTILTKWLRKFWSGIRA
jgi:NADP-dependent 3-hydroxy acid dehydrogenase YdfG